MLPGMNCIIDLTARIVIEANDAFYEKFGYDHDEIIGQKLTAFDTLNKEFMGQILENVIRFEYVEKYETVFHTKDGLFINVSITAQKIVSKQQHFALLNIQDITQPKSNKKLIEKQNQRLNAIINGTNVGTWEWNIQTGEAIYSERWAEIIGYTLKELEPVTKDVWFKHIHPEDLDKTNKLLEKHFLGETDFYDTECRMLHKNGAWVWVHDRGKVAEWDENGKPLWMFGTHQDISSRKEIEREVKKEKEQAQRKGEEYRQLFENMQQGFALLHMIYDENKEPVDFEYVLVNKAFGRLTRFNHKKYIGKTIKQLFPDIADYWIKQYAKVIKSDDLNKINYESTRIDRHFEIVAYSPLPEYIVSILSDITELVAHDTELVMAKERAELSEKRLKEAQEIAQLGSWEYDLENDHLIWSDEIFRIFECDPDEIAVSYDNFLSFIHPDDRKMVDKAYTQHIINKEPYDIIHRILLKDDKLKYVHERCTSVFDENGVALVSKGTVVDITERILIEEELKKAKEKAEESEKLKSAFLANMSHEIRTPMNAIIGFSEFFKDPDYSREELSKFADIIIRSGNHLLTVINDIVDLAKIDSGLIQVHKETFNLNKQMQELYEMFSTNEMGYGDKSLELLLSIPEKDFIIYTDPTRLRQILINLISNSLKFTEHGFVRFGYRPFNKKVEFFIEDTGVGIPKDKYDIIFNRFTQVNDSVTRLYGGNGLGLSVVKAYINLLGGTIWFDSEVGKGTTFYFTI